LTKVILYYTHQVGEGGVSWVKGQVGSGHFLKICNAMKLNS